MNQESARLADARAGPDELPFLRLGGMLLNMFKKCSNCGTEFWTKNQKDRICSLKCLVQFHRHSKASRKSSTSPSASSSISLRI